MQRLNLMAPIGYTGYGIAGMNILKALHKKGADVTLFFSGNPNVDNEEDKRIVEAAHKKQDNFDMVAPCLKIWHQFDLAQMVGKGEHIAYPFFELNRFNAREAHHIAYPDKIFVTSDWAAKIVERYRRDASSIRIVPLGVDPLIFSREAVVGRAASRLSNVVHAANSDTFVILNVGKWEKRKGHDIIPEIFDRAFGPKDKVALLMCTHNPFLNQAETLAWEKKYYGAKLGQKIQLVPRVGTHAELARLMASAHLGFFPSHAEGWNLELLEMMALGKHVVTTNYSAHTEFCTVDNATLIDIEEEETALDGKWFFGQGSWAKFGNDQIDAMVEALRDSYRQWQTNPDDFINNAGVATGMKFTWENAANKIMENI